MAGTSVYIDTIWHPSTEYTYKRAYGTLTGTSSGMVISASFSGTEYTTYTQSGSGYPQTNNCDTFMLYIDSTLVDSQDVSMYSGSYSVSLSGSRTVTTSRNTPCIFKNTMW